MRGEFKGLSGWIDGLERAGRYSFTLDAARRELSHGKGAVTKGLQRLNAKGRIHRVRRGFYVLVPLEYASSGIIPTEWFLADLMAYIGHPFYLGCLSAAAVHGAAHQRPQETQVVVPEHVRMVRTPLLRVRFLRFAGMSAALTQDRRTQTGDIPVSTPEWTAIDLIRFHKHYGSMDAAATVLAELSEAMDADTLADAARREARNAYLQRLGWMLDHLGCDHLTHQLSKAVQARKPAYVPLNPSIEHRGGERNSRWSIIVNERPESDL